MAKEKDLTPLEVTSKEELSTTETTVDATPETTVVSEAIPLQDRVISVDRVSRTQAGGRRIRFRALVAVGDGAGTVGLGTGKANEVVTAVAKATARAKKHLITVPIVRHTIPHEVVSKFGTAKVLLKPAPVGTSIIAGGAVRPILDLAGIENVVGKCLTRTTNKYNNAYATLMALQSLKDIKEVAPRYYTKKKKSAPMVSAPEEKLAQPTPRRKRAKAVTEEA